MNKATMDEITEFLRSVEGRTEDPNSKNPLTKDELSKLAKLRISGVLDEYMEQVTKDYLAEKNKKSKSE